MRQLCLLPLLLVAIGFAAPARADEAEDALKAQATALADEMKVGDPERRARAAQAALSVQHDSLVTPLIRLLADGELGVRAAATKALATRQGKTPRKRAAAALVPRLARLSRHPADGEELMTVIEALGALAQPLSIKPLLDGIKLDSDIEEVRARLMAVAEVPDAEAVDRLIQFLDRGRRGGAGAQREAARRALMHATGVRQNRDPDEWRAWWRENKKSFDFAAVAAARAEAAAQAAEKARRAEERKAERERKRREREEKREGKGEKEGGDEKEGGGGKEGGAGKGGRTPD